MKARREWAMPLVPLYAAVLSIKDGLRAVGLLRTRRLQCPVVSVGSLSAGGAGKTPVVIALAELLRGRGWSVDVLSRGYGREGHGVERVDAEADGAARRFGDEPVLIAKRTGVPVWVGASRFKVGVAAEASSPGLKPPTLEPDSRGLKPAATPEGETGGFRDDRQGRVHLLDDGFQHRKLARAMDVVLVTEEDLRDVLLPAGNLREPPSALWQVDVVVVREDEQERIEPRVRRLMRQNATVWTVRRSVEIPGVADGPERRKGLVAFCAIARPEDFFQTLRSEGVRVVHTETFPDHHLYTAGDVRQLIEACRSFGGDVFITTEKDAVKLTPELRAQLEAAAPLQVARLRTEFLDPDAVTRELEARLK